MCESERVDLNTSPCSNKLKAGLNDEHNHRIQSNRKIFEVS